METQPKLNKEQKSDIYWIDPKMIVADESFNIRQDYGDIESLMMSIVSGWVGNSILLGYRGEGGIVMLTDGFRRNRAIQIAVEQGLLDDDFRVPFRLHKKGYRLEDRLFDVYQTQDNKPLEKKEVCELFYRLKHNHNKTNDEIAKRIGKSPAFVSQMLSIAESPAEIRESVYSGELSTKDATVILTDAKKIAKQKNNGKPSNELSETIAVELKKKAIEEGKKDGLTVQSRKAKEKTEAPIGNLKKIAELSEIGVSQHMDADIVEFLDVLHEYLHDCNMTPMEFFERCMASKNAPVIG